MVGALRVVGRGTDCAATHRRPLLYRISHLLSRRLPAILEVFDLDVDKAMFIQK